MLYTMFKVTEVFGFLHNANLETLDRKQNEALPF